MASQCPKCRQPVDEDLICCGGIEFQWKCTQCQKRSRGFVVPFGRCPLCGGKVKVVDQESVTDNVRVMALQQAFQIEVSAYHFYRRLGNAIEDPETSDFFESLSQMEKEHAEELAQKYHLHLKGDVFRDADWVLPQPFFDDLSFFADTGDLRKLYESAISLEKRTMKFFSDQAQTLPEGREKDLYQELAAEESEHIALLESERDRHN